MVCVRGLPQGNRAFCILKGKHMRVFEVEQGRLETGVQLVQFTHSQDTAAHARVNT